MKMEKNMFKNKKYEDSCYELIINLSSLLIGLSVFFILLTMLSCSEEASVQKLSNNEIGFTVTARTKSCMPSNVVALAIVDENDKLEEAHTFNCNFISGSATLSANDVLILRVYTNGGTFDKSVRYDYTVTQNGEVTTYENIDFMGVQYVVK